MIRVSAAAKKFEISRNEIVDLLKKEGLENVTVNTKLSEEVFTKLLQSKNPASKGRQNTPEVTPPPAEKAPEAAPKPTKISLRPISKPLEPKGTVDLDSKPKKIKKITQTKPVKTLPEVQKAKIETPPPAKKQTSKKEPPKESEDLITGTGQKKLRGLKVLGTMDVPAKPKTPKKDKPEPSAKPKPQTKRKQEAYKKTPPKKLETKKLTKIKAPKPAPVIQNKPESKVEEEVIKVGGQKKLPGLKVLGSVKLPSPTESKPKPKTEPSKPASKTDEKEKVKKRKRKRIVRNNTPVKPKPRPNFRAKAPQPNQKEVDAKFKQTIARVQGQKAKNIRRVSRKHRQERREQRRLRQEAINTERRVIRVNEFIQLTDLATIMNVQTNELITLCLNMGFIVAINHRLDKETIEILASEFDYEVEFETILEEKNLVEIEKDKSEDLKPRSPIVTVMGHVDHGKTSLLDYIRNTKVADFEQGGITQHIGSYEAYTKDKQRVVFLDTPGHEAFTSMRARGAQVTDIAIIVIAADDGIKPRTTEAISHAQIASVPIIFAINKIDKPAANTERVKEQLASNEILVEDWGGKFPAFEVSAKTGQGIDDLLEGVLLEAEVLELKANPKKHALGTVIESSLDKGRGYVANMLVQAGTMRVGDVILAGPHYGKVKAIVNHQGKNLTEAGPATPVQILGLNGAPQAGEKFHVLATEKEAKEIASKRGQLERAQNIRATRRLTLADIGDRIAQGNFQELNLILKADVDGSIGALVNLLMKLSNQEVAVRIIHKAVGAISESDVMLASASDAIIIGFHVRPVPSAKVLAEKEDVEIRLYSVIYNIVDDVKLAVEGLLKPTVEEHIVGRVEVREVFKTKVGKIAGSYVSDGYIKRNSNIRLIRDNVKVYEGVINTLRRIKDDVNQVKMGFECGLTIKDFNDIKVGDYIEVYEEVKVKAQLEV